ncbi:MAG: NADH-quinone oxidoreductase subunit I, partial [Pseudoalteromonas tetraodonis]
MAIVVKRPKLKWYEQMYLPGIVKGLKITLVHAIKIVTRKKKVTMQYPEEKWDDQLPEYYRGAP